MYSTFDQGSEGGFTTRTKGDFNTNRSINGKIDQITPNIKSRKPALPFSHIRIRKIIP